MKESRFRFDISSAGLHILGMVIMLMDHAWVTIAPSHDWLTWVGRIAFPIFAFLTAEGYFRTKNFKGYVGRMALFALLAENDVAEAADRLKDCTLARGMAYPMGTYSDMVIEALEAAGICYSRTCKATENFKFPENWLTLHPTCHHKHPRLMELAQKFVEESPRYTAQNWMFYLWGHSYEFDNDDNWNVIEEFAAYTGGKDDIWYATNIEIYDYIKAYEALQVSVDESIVHNPTTTDLWFHHNHQIHCIHSAETLFL
jgi:hypothetical protein